VPRRILGILWGWFARWARTTTSWLPSAAPISSSCSLFGMLAVVRHKHLLLRGFLSDRSLRYLMISIHQFACEWTRSWEMYVNSNVTQTGNLILNGWSGVRNPGSWVAKVQALHIESCSKQKFFLYMIYSHEQWRCEPQQVDIVAKILAYVLTIFWWVRFLNFFWLWVWSSVNIPVEKKEILILFSQ